jgi:ribonuclease P protein component
MGKFSFQKKERLSRKKLIEELFEKGSSKSFFPLKVVFLALPGGAPHQVLISTPSKTFKRAVDRNKLKRRIREGYRLNKTLLRASPTFSLAYIYIAREVLPSTVIHKAIRSSLERLNSYETKD